MSDSVSLEIIVERLDSFTRETDRRLKSVEECAREHTKGMSTLTTAQELISQSVKQIVESVGRIETSVGKVDEKYERVFKEVSVDIEGIRLEPAIDAKEQKKAIRNSLISVAIGIFFGAFLKYWLDILSTVQ